MQEFVKWCNENQGFIGVTLSILTLAVSGIAVWISINTASRQNKIALFEKRLDSFQSFISIVNAAKKLFECGDSIDTLRRSYIATITVKNHAAGLTVDPFTMIDDSIVLDYFAMLHTSTLELFMLMDNKWGSYAMPILNHFRILLMDYSPVKLVMCDREQELASLKKAIEQYESKKMDDYFQKSLKI